LKRERRCESFGKEGILVTEETDGKRQLGNSDVRITPIGIGAWAMGGSGWAISWGPQNDDDSLGPIDAALDAGINWIDTTAVYGLGHSEEVVGKALRGRSNRLYVFTKCERTWDAHGRLGCTFKAESIRRECEASLNRLKIDVIDLYQIHWPEPEVDIEDGWTEMGRLKEEGKVRYIGVSNFNVTQMQRAADPNVKAVDPDDLPYKHTCEELGAPVYSREGDLRAMQVPVVAVLLDSTLRRHARAVRQTKSRHRLDPGCKVKASPCGRCRYRKTWGSFRCAGAPG
jgi:hypothetical protein